eukprot:COSAG01_NODE_51142_length_357_cov_0.794574_1_plen_82_part_01
MLVRASCAQALDDAVGGARSVVRQHRPRRQLRRLGIRKKRSDASTTGIRKKRGKEDKKRGSYNTKKKELLAAQARANNNKIS